MERQLTHQSPSKSGIIQMSNISGLAARILCGGFKRSLRAPNIVAYLSVIGVEDGAFDLEQATVTTGWITSNPSEMEWRNSNLAELIEDKDRKQVHRGLRRAVLSGHRTWCLARRKGNKTYCVLEMSPQRQYLSAVRLKVWHLSGVVGVMLSPPPWQKAMLYGTISVAAFASTFVAFRGLGADEGHASSCGLLMALFILGLCARDVINHTVAS